MGGAAIRVCSSPSLPEGRDRPGSSLGPQSPAQGQASERPSLVICLMKG